METLALVPRPCATPGAASAPPRKAPSLSVAHVASTPTALPPGWKRCNSSKRYRGPGGLTSTSVAAAYQLAGDAQFSTPGSRGGRPDEAPRQRVEKRPLPPRALPSDGGATISEEEAASLPLLEQWRLNEQGSCEGRVHGRSGYRPGSLMETSEVVATARVATAVRSVAGCVAGGAVDGAAGGAAGGAASGTVGGVVGGAGAVVVRTASGSRYVLGAPAAEEAAVTRASPPPGLGPPQRVLRAPRAEEVAAAEGAAGAQGLALVRASTRELVRTQPPPPTSSASPSSFVWATRSARRASPPTSRLLCRLPPPLPLAAFSSRLLFPAHPAFRPVPPPASRARFPPTLPPPTFSTAQLPPPPPGERRLRGARHAPCQPRRCQPRPCEPRPCQPRPCQP